MSKKNKKTDVLGLGVVAFAGGLGMQRLLLQEVMPYSQKYVADIGRKAFNDVVPFSMSVAVTVLDKIHAREEFKKGFLWFVYEFMARYSMNSISGFFFSKLKRGSKEDYRNLLRNYVQKMLTEQTDRDNVIKSATEEVMKILSVITEGTVASLIFNEKVAEAASGAISAAINRFLADDAANRLTDYILKFIGQVEDMTLPGFLEGVLGIGRTEMANLIDTAYDTVLSQNTVRTVKDMHAGDLIAEMINSVDYKRAYDNVSVSSLVKVSAVGAVAGMGTYRVAKRLEKAYERFFG